MLVTTTATTSTTTAPLSTSPMSLSSSPETNCTPTSFEGSIDAPDAIMQPFTPGQCLFCPTSSPSFTDSVIHMQKSHGLFIPHQQHLVVDLETLFRYLHLIIFGYRECIHCGTERATIQAVQQHMTGKGHCKLDISEQDSEFADFYNFFKPEDDTEGDIEADSTDRNQEERATSLSRNLLWTDQDSIRLPSGKIISKQSSAQAGPSSIQSRRRAWTSALQLEHSLEPDEEEGPIKEELNSDVRDTRLLSKREKRERASITYQLTHMSANDRGSLMHLPASQQCSILATQQRQAEKMQKKESRRQGRIDQKGNKNLYSYWATETPIYQCG
ncbi:C2H2 type zinc-finger-domain-containing protein [Hypoxylon rubiginosum]|uniref:C2H2 type zinc-finger-domain-containing protein n=1 Tax=Hypoxylon rubiginosum TaxID=110542 RepID=A0ACB9ZBC4_9PEZI|nr:C2H2 type zinc-finger-domain-containing protein [Hypoxylon rubiginosum]